MSHRPDNNSVARSKRGANPGRRSTLLQVDQLEDRVTPVVLNPNLQLTDLFFVNPLTEERMDSPPAVGEQVFVQAEWTTTDMVSENLNFPPTSPARFNPIPYTITSGRRSSTAQRKAVSTGPPSSAVGSPGPARRR